MPRFLVVIILILLAVAALIYFLSTQAGEVPTRSIEVPVNSASDAR